MVKQLLFSYYSSLYTGLFAGSDTHELGDFCHLAESGSPEALGGMVYKAAAAFH